MLYLGLITLGCCSLRPYDSYVPYVLQVIYFMQAVSEEYVCLIPNVCECGAALNTYWLSCGDNAKHTLYAETY